MFSNRFLNWSERLYKWIIRIGKSLQSPFLLFMRIVWGIQFWLTGIGKLMDPERVAHFFANLDIPIPYVTAIVVGIFEAIGGFFLIFGFSSRLICIPLAIILFTAYFTAHVGAFKDFEFLIRPSLIVKESPFPFLLTVLLVFTFGPGKISIDALIKRKLKNHMEH